jgi:hypothetical protein
VRRAAQAALLLVAWPGALRAQIPEVRGYYLNAALALEESPFARGGVLDMQRFRLMSSPALGSVTLDLAWEHVLMLRTAEVALGRGFEPARPAAPWMRLQGTIAEGRHARWSHAVDRLAVSVPLGDQARLTLGRQVISWATTLFFTPADPFVPFDPADRFREYRTGVDAVRLQVFPGPLTGLEAVVRPGPDVGGGETLTALVRARGVVRGVELSAWAGRLHDEPGGAVALTGSAGAWSLRAEAGLRREREVTVFRLAAGVDRLIQVSGRDLTLVLEYQRDGFGATNSAELIAVAASAAAARGELQVLGQDAAAASATWQVHPLTAASLLGLVNLRDGSVLLAPGVSRSLSNEATLRLGAYAGLGRGAAPGPVLRSEYGATPLVAYAAVTLFF